MNVPSARTLARALMPLIAAPALMTTAWAATPNPVASLPDLAPAAANPYDRAILAQVAPLHPKRLLLGDDPDVILPLFQRNSVGGQAAFADVPAAVRPG